MTGIYAGSFDPPTEGHRWMIREGARLFETFYVAVGTNPSKTCTYSVEQRVAWLTEIVRTNVDFQHIKIVQFGNKYLVNLAHELEATHILRGIRNAADYGYEHTIRHLNHDLNPGVASVFLMPPRFLSEVSSSVVKGLIGPEGWRDVVEQYVPHCVFRTITDDHV